jgi:hypothetical protein
MIIAAIILFAAAAVVHGGAFTVHTPWLDWQGLMLLGLLCLASAAPGAWPASLRLRRRPPD